MDDPRSNGVAGEASRKRRIARKRRGEYRMSSSFDCVRIIVAAMIMMMTARVVVSLGNSSRQEEILRSTGLLKFQPDKYQGGARRTRYFEGWYYKFVTSLDNNRTASMHDDNDDNDDDGVTSMAVVPGIFYGDAPDSNESHAFVFVTVNGERQHYYRFDVSGNNRFSHRGASVDLRPRAGDDADVAFRGELTFANMSPWPVSLTGLGAMGPVGWLPFLECTHGVLSFDHELGGSLTMTPAVGGGCDVGGGEGGEGSSSSSSSSSSSTATVITFDNGRGYTEKDFGRSFPSMWVWLQTNSFPLHPGTSLFVSVARVPVLGFGLPGFTAAVWHDSTLFPFATWSGATFEDMRVSDDEVFIAMRGGRRPGGDVGGGGGRHRVEITVDRRNVPEVLLYAPVNFTRMMPHVREALRARVRMRLFDGRGNVLVDDVGLHAGLEVHGNVRWLVDNVCGREGGNKFVCL